jgi:hypothetical protein
MDQSDDRGWSSLPVLWFEGGKPRSASQLLDAALRLGAKDAKVGKGRICNFAPRLRDTLTRGFLIFPAVAAPTPAPTLVGAGRGRDAVCVNEVLKLEA